LTIAIRFCGLEIKALNASGVYETCTRKLAISTPLE
jgi:hypothetical protein